MHAVYIGWSSIVNNIIMQIMLYVFYQHALDDDGGGGSRCPRNPGQNYKISFLGQKHPSACVYVEAIVNRTSHENILVHVFSGIAITLV